MPKHLTKADKRKRRWRLAYLSKRQRLSGGEGTMQEVERVLPPEGEGATGEVPKGEEDGFPPEEEIAHARV